MKVSTSCLEKLAFYLFARASEEWAGPHLAGGRARLATMARSSHHHPLSPLDFHQQWPSASRGRARRGAPGKGLDGALAFFKKKGKVRNCIYHRYMRREERV